MRAALALLLLRLVPAYGGQDIESTYYLAEGPTVTIPPSPPPGPAEAEHIHSLIDRLATLDHMFEGLCGSFTGFTPFIPVPIEPSHAESSRDSSAVVAFDELVRLGPAAIPFLLEAITNATPTRLTIEHGDNTMTVETFLHFNLAVKHELSARANLIQKRATTEFLDRHTVTIGDVCFAALGQITGRNYWPVSYAHTSCILVKSPSRDPQIGEQIRTIWSGPDPVAILFASLVRDLRTRSRYDRKDGDRPIIHVSYFQCDAVRRLLYYFPKQGVPLVVSRIDDLNRGWVFSNRMWERRFLHESVIHEQLLDVCARFPNQEVQAALARYHRRKAMDTATINSAPYLLGAGLAAGVAMGWRKLRRRRRAA
ncbi:MAG: hypothetical protein U1F77_03155 [Kiritimatiellia bacterium]